MHNFFIILPILSLILCIALGLFTLSRNPRHPANIGFLLGMINLSIIEIGTALALSSNTGSQQMLFGIRLTLIGQSLLPAIWLPFSLVFARADYKNILSRWSPVLAGMGVLSILFSFWIGSPDCISISSLNQTPLFIIGQGGSYLYIYFIMGLVLNLVHLENTLRSSKGAQRQQIKYVIFGLGAIFSFLIYFSSYALLFSIVNLRALPVISTVILLSSSTMAVSIVRHRLLDVDIFISRYVVYSSFSVLIVGLYLFLVGMIAEGIKFFGIPFDDFITTIFVFLSLLVLSILLFSAALKRKVQLFINRHFYKHKYEFRDKWMETIEKISSKRELEETYSALTEMISETMGADRVYLWLYNPRSHDYSPVQNGLLRNQSRIDNTHPLLQQIKTHMSPFIISDLCNEEGTLIASTGAVLCAPLITGRDIVGFVFLGEDLSGEPYRQDDFELLKAMTTQAAVQIKMIRFAQDIMTAKEIEAFHKLSSFIMHDLKNLTNSLSLVSQNARHNMHNPEFQHDAIKTIDGTVSRMKSLIARLSSVPKSIELKKRKVGLHELVTSVFKKINLSKIKNIVTINKTEGTPPIYVDPDAIEMVLLNLLTNAYDAIQKQGKIRVEASFSKKDITITISDDGGGMSREFIEKSLFKPFKTTKKDGFGIGLYQCKTIINAHNGNIEVESEEGTGTTFTVKLPIK